MSSLPDVLLYKMIDLLIWVLGVPLYKWASVATVLIFAAAIAFQLDRRGFERRGEYRRERFGSRKQGGH